MEIAATAAIMPPPRPLMCCGATLEKSNAGDTKLATMLMPMVATMKVSAPSTTAVTLSMRATMATGSVINSLNTGRVAEVGMTVSSAKPRKITGMPQKLQRLTATKSLPYREKSPKFSIGPEKYDTTNAIAPRMTGTASQPWYLTLPSVRLMFCQPALCTSHRAGTIITTAPAGPAQSMNLRIDSMPCQNTMACNPHSSKKPAQPSVDRPTKPCCATSA